MWAGSHSRIVKRDRCSCSEVNSLKNRNKVRRCQSPEVRYPSTFRTSNGCKGLWTRGLLIRRRIADDDLAFFTTWCPAGTTIETLVAVEGHRWAIEDSFETAKNEFGLDHNESRSWHGWHRHVSLVMLAFAMMAAIRHRANPPPPKKTKRRSPAKAKT